MEASLLKNKLLEEISKIPDDRVPEIFDFLHYFRIGLNIKTTNPQKVLQLAGSWNDMSENEFEDFLSDIASRRKNAFILRRNRETGIT